MARTPETRASLLLRVRNPADQLAWREFAALYRPVIYRLGRAKGMQHADAEDLAQHVLGLLARAIARFQPDPHRGRFRTWLFRVAQNASLNALTRGARERPVSDDELRQFVETAPGTGDPDSGLLRLEFQREVFLWAANQIRREFHDATWRAFWLTAVEDVPVERAAQLTHRTVGAVYTARSRIMKRLAEKVREFDDDDCPS